MNNDDDGSLSVDRFLDRLCTPEVLERLSELLDRPADELSTIIELLRKDRQSSRSGNEEGLQWARLYVDGASRGNPGPAGGGAVLINEDDEIIRSQNEFFGNMVTNNEAEYRALLLGLDLLPRNITSVRISMDSELVVKQLNGEYNVKSETLRPYFDRVKPRIEQIDSVTLDHVPREDNETADRLANEAIDRHRRRESLG